MGITEKSHINWKGWDIIKPIFSRTKNMKKTSLLCADNVILINYVKLLYKKCYWDKCRLDDVISPKICEEIMCFAVNVGNKTAIKTAQKVIGAKVDGFIGDKTIAELNNYDPKKFDTEFDKAQIEHYNKLVKRRPEIEQDNNINNMEDELDITFTDKFNLAFDSIKKLEFNNDKSKLLHKVKGESFLTFMGITEKSHIDWKGWDIIKPIFNQTKDMKKTSLICSDNTRLINYVKLLYKKGYWDKCRLDDVISPKICEEIMCFAVNVGNKTAIKTAQKVIGVKVDGFIGDKTIAKLNSFSTDKFDIEFDEAQIEHYDKLVKRKPKFEIYLKGWKKRAIKV